MFRNNINLEVQWVPRQQNKSADGISKYFDKEDWGVSDEFFQFMNQMWGPYSFDRFANEENNKVVNFNSKFWCEKTSGVDAFTQNWQGHNNWLLPPIKLVSKAILHSIACKSEGTLIVPHWPSASFWPFLFDQNYERKHFVADIFEFAPFQNIFVQGKNKKTIFGSEKFRNKVLAVRIAFE